jgi:aminoacrylate hydrolase
MPQIKIGDAELYYEIHGSGDPLVLVTGLGGNASYWALQVPMFAKDFKVVVYDHRGSGRSTMSPISYSVDQMTADVVALMDALEIERAHFVGHSLGGAIAQVMAIEHPDRMRSLVISSSWTAADPYFRRLFEVRRRILEDSGVGSYFRSVTLSLYPCRYIADNFDAAKDTEEMMIASAPPVAVIKSKIEAVLSFDRTADLGRIAIPTMVDCARDDIITPSYFSEELARFIPGAILAIHDDGAHSTPITIPETYHRHVHEFIESCAC